MQSSTRADDSTLAMAHKLCTCTSLWHDMQKCYGVDGVKRTSPIHSMPPPNRTYKSGHANGWVHTF